MPDSNEEIDERVANAVRDILAEREAGERPVIAEKAREYRVSKFRVQRRLKGIGPRISRKPKNYKLSEIQEQALLQYILSLDEIGQSIRYDHVNKVANEMLKEDHTENSTAPVVGEHWVKRFLNRHPELHKAKQKPLELERKLAHDPDLISNWFERFRALREAYGVFDDDIWNFDETGFRIGVGKSQWIVTSSHAKRHYLVSDNNREYVTAIEAVSATGIVIKPMLILPGKVHLERFYRDLKRMKCLWDCQILDTQMTSLPLRIFNILNAKVDPLDVVLFQPYKHWHAQAVNQATRTGCSKFDKLEFLTAIYGIRQSTFKNSSIRSSFRECGLIPYNPQLVLEKVKEYQPPPPPRPSTPPETEFQPPTTPLTPQALKKQAIRLENATPSRYKLIAQKFIKGAQIQVNTATQIKKDLAASTAAEKERRERRIQSQRQLQKGGVLLASQARNMVTQRVEEGGTQLQRALWREEDLRKELEDERHPLRC
ncbi:hypothetical protein EPUS_02918 [Endocarpon pusillum Z07020]|uniref:HTH CENPB-type domain-containing protein n=1 Tax=Endocarpon pusillum (strain Z07020 / HMAS-L-300199) TaxID=1263415 RepID=U1G4B7_ENDPU|nr:uncharacterized protein EPUS_02918 [Endocarpon pusillum Z07020]ERF72127.1 hypothetical protein EPUS_02918 [Endocarpon pusillum Z07020]